MIAMAGKRQKKYKTWLMTFTKMAVMTILAVALIDLQLSYILAFMGKEQIAETLSARIVEMIVGVMLGYFLKSLFETFLEGREKGLNKQIKSFDDEIETEGENI